jgi:hypothetical protein
VQRRNVRGREVGQKWYHSMRESKVSTVLMNWRVSWVLTIVIWICLRNEEEGEDEV